MNESKSSNNSREKKIFNQANYAKQSGISLNLMRCLKDIDKNMDKKIVDQKKSIAQKNVKAKSYDPADLDRRSVGQYVRQNAHNLNPNMDDKESASAVNASKSHTGRAQANNEKRKDDMGESLREQDETSKFVITEASCPQSKELDSS